ncbi:MAG: hypothetical protein BSOLF_0364 [Candidatus Carbobacillus altaicus]|uniref:Uncharacterized protein n=1 Tax=Candidatus Carbonibacillus altaicus TaxID=2163959 RepID=A0A2R6Y0W9_9BACL|nr:MAG: hypothetical protein BSOLF_1731 [Candidatus Carbobacillus altaicus]PTQ56329.1 MAG: hypothetical protein BSOLF_0364 [Candidatus Carbobacillus altaicus]
MTEATLFQLARTYFELSGSTILEEEPPRRLTVELSQEADQALGYRPFYWSYITLMRMKPELLKKTYRFWDEPGSTSITPTSTDQKVRTVDDQAVTDQQPNATTQKVRTADRHPTVPSATGHEAPSIVPLPGFHQQEEWLSFGSPRLYRLFEAMMDHGRYTSLYASNPRSGRLTPHLLVIYTIAQVGAHRKESIESYLIRLTDLALRPVDPVELFAKENLSPHPPHYTALLPRMFHPKSALSRSHEAIQSIIEERLQPWVREAEEKLTNELARLKTYYDTLRDHLLQKGETVERKKRKGKPMTRTPDEVERAREARMQELEEAYKMRKAELEALYTPRILVELEQIALLYLD